MTTDALLNVLRDAITSLGPELIELRRDLHQHPELSRHETRTTAVVSARLSAAGLRVRPLPGTGLVADVGATTPARRVALRADLDALPVQERTGLPFASVNEGVCHACGHDIHTAAVVGAGLALREHEAQLVGRGLAVRLIFQAAEEVIPGGALGALEAGAMDGVDAIYAMHCDPTLDRGEVGLREGAITAACDSISVHLKGRGGHTSRPHLTEDLTFALAKVVTEVPAALSRRLDPRAGAALVWGTIHAGQASNVIPASGDCTGTLRMLDASAWEQVGPLLEEIVAGVVAPYGVHAELERVKGVPPVVNSVPAIATMRGAALEVGLAPVPTTQSLGGEDFAWYLASANGAMARLGTRGEDGQTYDLHQGDLVIDEGAITHGAMFLAACTLGA